MQQANVTRLMIMLMVFFYQNQYLKAQQIAAGTVCSFAVCSENTAQGWGDNGNGTLGDGNIDTFSIVPVSVAMTDVIAVASGGKHTLGLKKDGTVWAWGLNSTGCVCKTIPVKAVNLCKLLSLEKLTLPLAVNIFPNPFTTETMVSVEKELRNGIVKIIDLLGNEIQEIPFSGKKLIIEKRELKAGIYFIQIMEGDRISTHKIILQ